MSIVIDFKLLISIDKQLQKSKNANIFSTTFFEGFFLVVLIENFY